MISKAVSHYKIIEKLGSGGMGVVYKAQDTKLDRFVALKFLPSHLSQDDENKKRFVHEAKAASALNHPNIATIYEINESDGQMFIAMEYTAGRDLKSIIESRRLSIDDVLDCAIQIAEGLAKAHEKGIIHRDIKPANILVTENEQVKIVDFGLAKLTGQTQLTKEGMTLGTVAYMSPEQTYGTEVDHRSDIWSLGVVLYEMVTGQQPFKGDYEQAVVYSILNEEPEAICELCDIPEALQQIVNKTLAKNPEERYQQMAEVLSDLKTLIGLQTKPAPAEGKPSIAVLPFVNMSADPENEYFSDGLAEELINALTKIKGLRVVARTSAFSLKGKNLDIREIGQKLNVETVLEGSVRKAGDRLRITAQLVNVVDGYDLWSEKYDRELDDVFAIQDEISLAIVDNLKVKLLGKEKDRLVKRYTENWKAYDLYLKGRYYLNKRTAKDFEKAIEYFQQAIAMEPNYALAYAGLADTHNLLERYGVLPPNETLPKAEAAALKACKIDNTLAEAYTALAYNKMFYKWDWVGSENDFRHAIDLNPKYSIAHHWFAWFLAVMGRHSEAMAEMKRAQELDPLSLIINTNVGSLFYFEREYDKAIEQLQKTLEIEPGFVVAHQWLGRSYEQKKLYAEAIEEHQKAINILGDDPESLASLAHAYAVSGKRAEAKKILAKLQELSKRRYVSQYWTGLVYIGLGKLDQSFKCLKNAADEGFDWLIFAKVEPMMDPLRSDRRFAALLKKLGLSE